MFGNDLEGFMEKIALKCDFCGNINIAKIGFFAKKSIKCDCGNIIAVKLLEKAMKKCPYCKENVIYDKASGGKAICAGCKKEFTIENSKENIITPVSDEEIRKMVIEITDESSKVEAIKYYRNATGAGLLEAKEAVEAILAQR